MQGRAELLQAIQARIAQYEQEVGRAQALTERVQALDVEIAQLRAAGDALEKVLSVFHALSASVHEQFTRTIEDLITEGLTAVFGQPLRFTIIAGVRGKNVNMDFAIVGPDGEPRDLIDAHGGGLVSMVGVLLRLVVLRLLSRDFQQVLLLDEPLAHLSECYIEPAAQLLARLSRELGVQILMVTHQPGFAAYADTVYEVAPSASGTLVTRLGQPR